MKLLHKMHKYEAMLTYCLKCRKNTKIIKIKISVTSNGKTIILPNCAILSNCAKNRKQMGYWVV